MSATNKNPGSPASTFQSSEIPCHKPSVTNRVTNLWPIIADFIVGFVILCNRLTFEGRKEPFIYGAL